MSLLSQLKKTAGSVHARKRVGRGRGSGLGQTSGKGHKGQLARTGGKVRRGFEGGQSPLVRRLPKFGFSNVSFQNRFEIVNLGQIEKLAEAQLDPQAFKKMGLVSKTQVKILAQGKLTKKVHIKAHKFSEAAKKAIEAAGGTAEVIG